MARKGKERIRPRMIAVELPSGLKVGLEAVKERDGVPISVQIRRAVYAWLESRAIDPETGSAPKTRKR